MNKTEQLRVEAEKIIKELAVQIDVPTQHQVKTLIHELNVHQVELELQNDELYSVQLKLQNSRDSYFDLYDNAPIGYLTTDNFGAVLMVNNTIAQMLGASKEKLQHDGISHFCTIQDSFYLHIRNFINNNLNATTDMQFTREDKSTIYVSIDSKLVQNRSDIVKSVITDITVRKKAEEKIKRYTQSQEILLQEVNHRVKNNLYTIVGLLQKYEDKIVHAEPSDSSKSIVDIIRRVESLSLVHTMLSGANWSPIPLADLVTNISEHIINDLPHKKPINLIVSPSSIKLDNSQCQTISLVINEIITNAIKHSNTVADVLMISVKIDFDEENIYLNITDNGVGFPQKILAHKFKKSKLGFYLIFGLITKHSCNSIKISNHNGAQYHIVLENTTV